MKNSNSLAAHDEGEEGENQMGSADEQTNHFDLGPEGISKQTK